MAAPAVEELTYEDVEVSDQCFDLAFHPTRNILAAGLISGKLCFFDVTPTENKMFLEIAAHGEESCRSIQFSADGNFVHTGGADCQLATFDLAAGGKSIGNPKSKSSAPINVVQAYDNNILVSGDDDGNIKLWDMRDPRSLGQGANFTEHEDFISDIWPMPSQNHILCTGGDGYLSVWDVRGKGKLVAMSDNLDDELLSLVVLKDGKKVVCGSQDGVLHIFTYGLFGDVDDRFPGHPNSVDTMLFLNEHTIITGSSDGLIRVVQIHPNKLLGVVGEHEDFPVEVLAQNANGSIVASASHDVLIKLWDTRYLHENDGSGPVEDPEDAKADSSMDGPSSSSGAGGAGGAGAGAGAGSADDEDADMSGEDSDESDEDSDDSEDEKTSSKKKGKKKAEKTGARSFKSAVTKQRNSKFFDDL